MKVDNKLVYLVDTYNGIAVLNVFCTQHIYNTIKTIVNGLPKGRYKVDIVTKEVMKK